MGKCIKWYFLQLVEINVVTQITMKWYNQAIPRIRDFKTVLNTFVQSSKNYKFIKNIYVFGEYVTKFKDQNYRIKDIDILVDTDIYSGDLLAIDNSQDGALCISHDMLEDLGFNKYAVSFTENILQHKINNIEFWVGSTDGKVLHWGPMGDTLEDWYRLKREAENKAEIATCLKKAQIIRASEDLQQKWNEVYDSFMASHTKDCPQGWYESENSLETILKTCMPIQNAI